MLRNMLKRFYPLPGSILNADSGYDAELNLKSLYRLLMKPNNKQLATQKAPKGKRGQEASLP